MTRYIILLSLLLLFLVFACTYKPEDEYFQKLELGNPRYSIELADFSNGDTIKLNTNSRFDYTISATQGQIEQVEVLIDDRVIHNSNSAIGQFSISHSLLKTGIYELKLQFTASSGTGSIADREGVEKVKVWGTWILEIDVDLPPTPQLTAAIEDGFAKVRWTPYAKKNFVQYSLVVSPRNGSQKTYLFADRAHTVWTDSSFAGGNATDYTLVVHNEVGRSQAVHASHSHSFSPTISFNALDSLVTLQWQTTPYFGAFEKYVITEEGKELASISDPARTSFKFKPSTLGLNYTTSVFFDCRSRSTSYNGNTSAYLWITQDFILKRMRRPDQLYFNEGVGRMIGYSSRTGTGWILKYNQDLIAEDSISFDILSHSIPFRGHYAYYPERPNVMRLDLNTFESLALVAISSPTGFASGPSAVTGAANGIVSYSFFGPNPIGSGAEFYGRIYDPAANHFRYSDATLIAASRPTISEDAIYMRLTGNRFYKYTSNSYILVGAISDADFLFFRQDTPGEIVCSKGTPFKLLIYDANTLALKRTIVPPGGAFTSYDPVTRKAIFCNPGSKHVYAVDIDTNEVILINAYTTNYDQYKMVNGLLMSFDGHYLKIF